MRDCPSGDQPQGTLTSGDSNSTSSSQPAADLTESFTEPGPIEKDAHKVEKITLTKGVNVIVFKIINDTNDWQGCVRFTDKSDKPVTGYAVKLTP